MYTDKNQSYVREKLPQVASSFPLDKVFRWTISAMEVWHFIENDIQRFEMVINDIPQRP